MADMIRPEDIRRIISDSDRRQPGEAREPSPLTRRAAVEAPQLAEPDLTEPSLRGPEASVSETEDKPAGPPGGWIDPPSAVTPERRVVEPTPALEPEPPPEPGRWQEEPDAGTDLGGYDGPPLGAPERDFEADLAEEAPAPRRRRRILLPLLVVLLALAGLAAAYLYGFKGKGIGPSMEAPTLKAQVEVDKVKPSEPGGLQIPNRDVQVLDQSASRSELQAVVLQPPPEEPAPLPPVPQPKVATEPDPAVSASEAEDQIAAVIQQSQSEGGLEGTAPTDGRLAGPGLVIPPRPSAKLDGREDAVAAALAGGSAPAASEASAAASEPKETTEATASTTTTASSAATSGAFLIQLASLDSAEAAEQSWKTMSPRQAAQLSGLSHSVQRVEIEGRGTFYRLRAGPFADRAAAQARCAKLKDAGQACIVVAP